MSEKPIIFSGPMVRAILEGRKTMTRRVLKIQPTSPATMFAGLDGVPMPFSQCWAIWPSPEPDENGNHPDHGCKFPYGVVGDRLWVRETFADVNCESGPAILYKADSGLRDWHEFSTTFGPNYGGGPSMDYKSYPGSYSMWWSDLLRGAPDHSWRSPIHMPRWASRITLEITSVRVERVQKITDDDIKAEGIDLTCEDGRPLGQAFWQDRFWHVWDEINGKKHPWESNPWAWVVAFKKV